MVLPVDCRRRFGLLLVLALLPPLVGCGEPSAEARQNRRLVDSLLTAVTIKNRKELMKVKGLLDGRHADGFLSAANNEQLGAIFEQANAGQWAAAEVALYRFTESQPFPK